MNTFTKCFACAVALSLASTACAFVPDEISGASAGDFVIIGTFCIPRVKTDVEKITEGTSDKPKLTVTVKPNPSEKQQKLLLYTDEMNSLPGISGQGVSCATRGAVSKQITVNGVSYTDGYPIGDGTSLAIEIKQAQARQWYVAVANCDSKAGSLKPVKIDQYTVKTDVSESCMSLRQEKSLVGYIVTITVSVFMIILFAGMTFKFYKEGESFDAVKARYESYQETRAGKDML
jgi:hypothetical protein|eukprot:Stramenopile-MAST_4_protein_3833